MARDAALLGLAITTGIAARVYSWDGPWVSLGRFQSPAEDLLPTNHVPWVTRPTGGNAVLHGHDATIGLAVSMRLLSQLSGEPPERLSRSVKSVYRLVSSPIIAALRECGLDATLGEESPAVSAGPRSSDCFAKISPNDIADPKTGRKVCGCALRLGPEGVLVQASIPCGQPLVDPADVFPIPADYSAPEWDKGLFGLALNRALLTWTKEKDL